MSAWSVAVIALAATLAATPLAIVAARRTGIVDRPGGALKPQTAPVPYLGGVAVFAGLIVGSAVGRPAVLVPLTLALGLGVADDRFGLPPVLRLAGQLAVGAAVAATCPLHLPGVAAIAVIAVTALLINGVNLIDGLDMLAAGVVAVAAIGFAVALHGPGRQLAVALAASLIGFLFYNRPPARVYLGDGGSYLLGAALAVLLAYAWGPGVPVPVGTAALALVAVAVAEVAFAVVRRARGRRSLMAGDRGHPYDRLVARGWPRSAASGAYVAIEAILAAGALLAIHRHSLTAAVVLDAAAAVLLVALAGATGALTPDDEEART